MHGPAGQSRHPRPEREDLLRTISFFRRKAAAIPETAALLVERHEGAVPADLEALTALRGVGRKTANVVPGCAFGLPAGVVVDTHVKRLSRRLGLTRQSDPIRIERELMRLFPRAPVDPAQPLADFYGRRCSRARKPEGPAGEFSVLCPSAEGAARR